jgi:D-galactarolactone cycloisomerase
VGRIEHALWDAIGKVAGQPVSKLLGGTSDRVKAYVTCVWKGKMDQSHVSYDDQAAMAAKLKRAGFKGMKIRAWRPDPMDDVAACRAIKKAVGPDFAVMFDRTAHRPEDVGQKVWDYETGRKVARGLQEAGAGWLEEPFARDDYQSPAVSPPRSTCRSPGRRLRRPDGFRECATHKTYDILQPEGERLRWHPHLRESRGIAQAFQLPCILHGSMALRVAGWLQATLAIGSEWQEPRLVAAPAPRGAMGAGLKVLKRRRCSRSRRA